MPWSGERSGQRSAQVRGFELAWEFSIELTLRSHHPSTERVMAQSEQKKIRSRLRSYERKLQQEKKEHGYYRDGVDKRYQIGPHYMLLGDNDGALAAFEWFEKEFPDDIGVPDHFLCWSLALHRAGNEIGAARKLRQTMFSNLYLLPRLLGSPIAELDIWHGSSDAEPSYVEHIHEPLSVLNIGTPQNR